MRSTGRATLMSPAPRRHPVFTEPTIGQTPDCAAEKWTSYSRRPPTVSLSTGILAGENELKRKIIHVDIRRDILAACREME